MSSFPLFNPPITASCAIFAVALAFYWRSRKYSDLPLPPGPKRHFLVGNLFDAPKEFPWLKYREWAKQFNSNIIYLNMAGQHIIVLDTLDAIIELLEKRSSIYSSRPRFVMVNELMGWECAFGMLKNGDTWRNCRKIAHQGFHHTVIKRFRPQELRAARRLLRRLAELSDSSRVLEEMRQFAAETVMAVTYGLDVQQKDDPYVKLAEKAMEPFSRATPGSYLVDSIPVLKYIPEWFPGAEFKRKAKVWKASTVKMAEVPFNAAKENIMNGIAKPSLVKDGFERMNMNPDSVYTEDNLRRVATAMYGAAVDTTAAVLSWTMIGFLMHPEYLVKAQKELDSVLEPGQLPTFEDEDSLPYIQAIVREAVRWHDVVPISIPRENDTEDVYNGYRIPVNSVIIPNLWAILHDENRYSEPFKFNPDRFMENGKLRDDVYNPLDVVFGFGRRACVGKHVAQASIWVALASIIAVFDLEKAVDNDGNIIEISDASIPGVTIHPRQLHCIFKPRSKAVRDLIFSTEHEECVDSVG